MEDNRAGITVFKHAINHRVIISQLLQLMHQNKSSPGERMLIKNSKFPLLTIKKNGPNSQHIGVILVLHCFEYSEVTIKGYKHVHLSHECFKTQHNPLVPKKKKSPVVVAVCGTRRSHVEGKKWNSALLWTYYYYKLLLVWPSLNII